MKYTARFPTESIQKKFSKELSSLSQPTQDQVWEAIRCLENNPRPFGTKIFKQLKPPVTIFQFVAQYRARVGNYRILYDVDDRRRVVWIFALRRRNEQTYG